MAYIECRHIRNIIAFKQAIHIYIPYPVAADRSVRQKKKYVYIVALIVLPPLVLATRHETNSYVNQKANPTRPDPTQTNSLCPRRRRTPPRTPPPLVAVR